MSESARQKSEDCIELTGMIDVDSVAKYRESLTELISAWEPRQLRLELGKIEVRGSAVIALLIWLAREARKLQIDVFFEHSSEELLAIASACGVDKILALT